MQPAPPAALQLAQRLRQLRQQWPDARLTQENLANAFSAEEKLASATVSSWESRSSPKLPPRHRLRAYARFFATQRSIEAGPKLLTLEELTPDEQAAYKKLETELLRLRSAAAGESTEEEIAFSRSWHFTDTGRVTFVCAELPEEADRTASRSVKSELYGTAGICGRGCPDGAAWTYTGRKPADDRALQDPGRHRTRRSYRTPCPSRRRRLERDNRAAVRDGEAADKAIRSPGPRSPERSSLPTWMAARKNSGRNGRTPSGKTLAEDVGLLARVPNPLNSSRTLTICNGIHSRGVYGAVRSLTDAQLRDANERYIAAHFGNSDSFAILMSVQGNKEQGDDSRLQQRRGRALPVAAGYRRMTATGRGCLAGHEAASEMSELAESVRQLDTHRKLVSQTEQRELSIPG